MVIERLTEMHKVMLQDGTEGELKLYKYLLPRQADALMGHLLSDVKVNPRKMDEMEISGNKLPELRMKMREYLWADKKLKEEDIISESIEEVIGTRLSSFLGRNNNQGKTGDNNSSE